MFTYSNGYWEVYICFQTDCLLVGEGVTWEALSIKEFVMGEEKFHEGGAGFSSTI